MSWIPPPPTCHGRRLSRRTSLNSILSAALTLLFMIATAPGCTSGDVVFDDAWPVDAMKDQLDADGEIDCCLVKPMEISAEISSDVTTKDVSTSDEATPDDLTTPDATPDALVDAEVETMITEPLDTVDAKDTMEAEAKEVLGEVSNPEVSDVALIEQDMVEICLQQCCDPAKY